MMPCRKNIHRRSTGKSGWNATVLSNSTTSHNQVDGVLLSIICSKLIMSSRFVTLFAKHSDGALSNLSNPIFASPFLISKFLFWGIALLSACLFFPSPRNNLLYACRFLGMSSRKAGTAWHDVWQTEKRRQKRGSLLVNGSNNTPRTTIHVISCSERKVGRRCPKAPRAMRE